MFAGLIPTLRAKVAGIEGNIDELLVKAKFEEAKLHDLSSPSAMVVNGQRPQPHRTETNNAPHRQEPGMSPQVPRNGTKTIVELQGPNVMFVLASGIIKEAPL